MNKKQKRIALAVALSIPLQVLAVSFTGFDTLAGLGTEVELSGLNPSEQMEVSIVPPYGAEIVRTVTGNEEGKGVAHINGSDLQQAGVYNVEAGGTYAGQFEVFAGSMDPRNSSTQASQQWIAADGSEQAEIAVVARDSYGNPLSGRTFTLVSSRSSDRIIAKTSETDESGQQLFGVSATEAGQISLRAIDLLSGKTVDTAAQLTAGSMQANIGGTYNGYNTYNNTYPTYNTPTASYGGTTAAPRYNGDAYGRALYAPARSPYAAQVAPAFGPLAGFQILVNPQIRVNEDTNMTIRAVDANGTTVEDYTGTVYLSSTDPNAFLPLNGEIMFRPQDLGQKTLTLGLRFRSGGEQILHAEDSQNPLIASDLVVNVIGDSSIPSERLITVTSHENNQGVSSNNIVLEGTSAPFINLLVTGGEQDVRGETDATGTFSIPVTLMSDKTEHTLRIRDDSGRYDSGNLNLVLDVTAPTIEQVTFNPQMPEAESNATATVVSEVGLKSVSISIGDARTDLIESGSGTYTGTITMPTAGDYQATVTAVDSADNEREMMVSVTVTPRTLPMVENLVGELQGTTVRLSWDALTGIALSGYRIYVGTQENDYLYTLDTDGPVTAATVTGLTPATTYFFAVTALEGESESAEKSNIVQVGVQGVKLEVTEQDNSLLLEWTPFDPSVPLSSYLLEYGVEPGQLTEQRILNGELQRYVLRDLLNGIQYYLQLTPVTTTGDILRDTAARGDGTPNGDAGFRASAGDPAPDFPTYGGVNPNQHAPSVSNTGIPFSFKTVAFAITALIAAAYVYRRRKAQQMHAFLSAMENLYQQR